MGDAARAWLRVTLLAIHTSGARRLSPRRRALCVSRAMTPRRGR